jgi:hypothetical protein
MQVNGKVAITFPASGALYADLQRFAQVDAAVDARGCAEAIKELKSMIFTEKERVNENGNCFDRR